MWHNAKRSSIATDFDVLATSHYAMPQIDILIRDSMKRYFRLAREIGIGAAVAADPCHTTLRTGPYTAVREVTLLLVNQRTKAKRFEVVIGKPHRKGFGDRGRRQQATPANRLLFPGVDLEDEIGSVAADGYESLLLFTGPPGHPATCEYSAHCTP